MKTLHGSTRFQCPICIKRFTQNINRKRHISSIHSDEHSQKIVKDQLKRLNYEYDCKICQKRFQTRRFLNQHIDGFHASKYLQCNQCIRRFPWESSLIKHTKLTHKKHDLVYEKSCLNGMNQWKFMVDQCVPSDIMITEDLKHIQLYKNYVRNKAAAYMDNNVDYTKKQSIMYSHLLNK